MTPINQEFLAFKSTVYKSKPLQPEQALQLQHCFLAGALCMFAKMMNLATLEDDKAEQELMVIEADLKKEASLLSIRVHGHN